MAHGGHAEHVLGYNYIDIEKQDEYPWAFCLVFMEGVHDELSACYTEPFDCKPLSVSTLVHHQLKGATRGRQDGAAVDWAVTQTVKFLDTVGSGNEAQHLAWLRTTRGVTSGSPTKGRTWLEAGRLLTQALEGCAFLPMEAAICTAHQRARAHRCLE